MKKGNRAKPRTKKPTPRRSKAAPIERQYQQIFTPRPLPYQGHFADEDSLEQPSELVDILTTSAPSIEA